jgi:hypothetical protein
MTRARLVLLALALGGLACGKQTFLAAVFVQTPALKNPVDPANGIPPFQVVTAYFGTIDTTSPTSIDPTKLAPITDATVDISFHHTGTGGSDPSEDRALAVPAAANPAGSYVLSSKDQPQLTFEAQTPYTLVLQTAGPDGEAYGARLTPGTPDDLQEFTTSTCTVLGITSARCRDLAKGSPLVLNRTASPAGQERRPAFLLVGQIDPAQPAAQPQITFQTLPDSAVKMLKYVLSDRDYRWETFTVDATAFPAAGYYLVSLLTVKPGKVSGNAFLGSTALAATGAAGVVHVQ